MEVAIEVRQQGIKRASGSKKNPFCFYSILHAIRSTLTLPFIPSRYISISHFTPFLSFSLPLSLSLSHSPFLSQNGLFISSLTHTFHLFLTTMYSTKTKGTRILSLSLSLSCFHVTQQGVNVKWKKCKSILAALFSINIHLEHIPFECVLLLCRYNFTFFFLLHLPFFQFFPTFSLEESLFSLHSFTHSNSKNWQTKICNSCINT